MIGTACAMLVNARSSNHEPNQEADRDAKRLSERDSFLCEQALYWSTINVNLKELKDIMPPFVPGTC